MNYRRLIPVILLKHGMVVRSELFTVHQVIGNPIDTIRRLSSWNVDELVLLDISESDFHDIRRDDLFVTLQNTTTLGILKQIGPKSALCRSPSVDGSGRWKICVSSLRPGLISA